MKKILTTLLMFLAVTAYSAPAVTIWNRENTSSIAVSSTNAMIVAVDSNTLVNVSGSTVAISNLPSIYNVSGSTIMIDNVSVGVYNNDGISGSAVQKLSVLSFPMIFNGSTWDRPRGDENKNLIVRTSTNSVVSVSNQISGYATESTLAVLDGKIVEANTKDVAITSGTLSVDNFPSDYLTEGGTVAVSNLPTDYATETTLAEVRGGLKAVAVTSGTISVNNLPAIQMVSLEQSTATMIGAVVIRHPTTVGNVLRPTSSGSLDVRLKDSGDTLITTTNPVPVSVWSVWLSSYTETESTGTIKSGATDIARVVIGTRGVGSQIIIRDGTSGAAPIVATIDTGANASVPSVELGLRLATGLYIEAIGATPAKLTIVYR